MDSPEEVKANPVNTDCAGREMPNSSFALGEKCQDCGSTDFVLRDYSMAAHDGDIHCAKCGKFIRVFDAG